MSELNVKVGKLEENSKIVHKRLDTHDVEIRELKNVYNALTKVDEKVKNVENDVQEIKTDMKEIKNKPAKKWDKLIDYIFYAVLGSITKNTETSPLNRSFKGEEATYYFNHSSKKLFHKINHTYISNVNAVALITYLKN